MPLPNDPRNRWWREVSNLYPEEVDRFRHCLVAFMAFGLDREPGLAGTGFIILSDPRFALVITARHVIVEGIQGIQQPRRPHAPSAIFFSERAGDPQFHPEKVRALWGNSRHASALNVSFASFGDSPDVAACVVMPLGDGVVFDPRDVRLDTTIPRIGEEIHVVSMARLSCDEIEPPQDRSGLGQHIRVSRSVSIRFGVVTGVYLEGLRHHAWPCFTASIPVEPGMSGGFAFVPRLGEKIGACGILSADNSTPEARADFRVCGESIFCCVYPALALRCPVQVPATPETAHRSLYEMMGDDLINAAVGIERFEVDGNTVIPRPR